MHVINTLEGNESVRSTLQKYTVKSWLIDDEELHRPYYSSLDKLLPVCQLNTCTYDGSNIHS